MKYVSGISRNLVWTDFINEAQQNIGIYTDNAG